jgi:hypothetical protein
MSSSCIDYLQEIRLVDTPSLHAIHLAKITWFGVLLQGLHDPTTKKTVASSCRMPALRYQSGPPRHNTVQKLRTRSRLPTALSDKSSGRKLEAPAWQAHRSQPVLPDVSIAAAMRID